MRLVPIALLLLLAGCASAPQNKEAVERAVIDYLNKRDDMLAKSMHVEVVSVSFHEKQADAVVSVGPKDMPGSGIKLNYTLDAEGRNWVVRKKPGAAANPHGGDTLPQGHPAIPKAN